MGKIKLQSFTILLNKDDALYTLGEYLSGFSCLSLKGEMDLHQLEIRLFGLAETNWEVPRIVPALAAMLPGSKMNTDKFNGSHIFLCQSYFPSSELMYMKLSNGEHRIPFNFIIPESEIPNSYESQRWSIKYFVEGIIHKNSFSNHCAKAHFNISFPVFIDEQLLKVSKSFSTEKLITSFCCSTSLISLKASIAHIGQRVGSFTSVNCIAFNGSKSTINLRATLKLITHLKAGKDSTVERKSLSKVLGKSVNPGMTDTETLSILIPDNLPILYDCPLIKLKYIIVVKLVIPSSSDLSIELPLLLTNQELSFDSF